MHEILIQNYNHPLYVRNKKNLSNSSFLCSVYFTFLTFNVVFYRKSQILNHKVYYYKTNVSINGNDTYQLSF